MSTRSWGGSRVFAGQFALLAISSLASVGVMGVLLTVQLRQFSSEQATRRAGELAELTGREVVAPKLTSAVLDGDRAALDGLDATLRPLLITGTVARIKVWDASGRIVYSDERRLIGRRFEFGPTERRLLQTRGVHTYRTDLGEPDNRYERDYGELFATYAGIVSPGGQPMIFESYEKLSSLEAGGSRAWRELLPSLLGGLVLLGAANLALAGWLARRARDDARKRAELRERALHAGEVERRRIAADLHDSVVRDLTGVSFALAGAVVSEHPPLDPATAELLERVGETTRHSVRQLRTLLVEIFPQALTADGLGHALEDLVAEVRAHGLEAELFVPADLTRAPEAATILLFRAAREGVRNAVDHAQARRVEIRVSRPTRDRLRLEVRDDGIGFDHFDAATSRHVGLRALRHMLSEADGSLAVDKVPDDGTVLRAEVPAT